MYQNEIRNSMRKSARVTRKTVYGEKYDYGEKVKEKRNYILYVSGTGREKKEIEEIELAPPQTKILEERQLIDNYQYHESKNIKKQNPNRLSFTHHKRLSGPFETTTYHEVTEDGIPIKSYNKITKNIYKDEPFSSKVRYDSYEKNRKTKQFYQTENRTLKNYSNFQNLQNFKKYENTFSNTPKTEIRNKYITKVRNIRKPFNENKGFDFDFGNKSTQQLRNVQNFGNFTYYESKNVAKKETINKPVSSYQYSREIKKVSGNLSCDKNLRNGGKNYNSKYVKKEVRSSSGYKNYDTGRKEYVKYQRTQQVNCPRQGCQNFSRKYVY